MTPAEAALVLAKAAAFDNRTVGRADAEAWAEALAGLDPQRCIRAVTKHYAENTDRIMPAHIRALVRTTTDITRGETITQPLPDGTRLCPDCRGVHHPNEDCTVLKADDARWRRALAFGRQMPRLTARETAALGGPRRKALAPPREVSEVETARNERERERQLDAVQNMISASAGAAS